MNFRTTLILILTLGLAAVAVFFIRKRDADAPPPASNALLTLKPESVARLTITPADGRQMAFERIAPTPTEPGGAWRMMEPTNAPAQSWQVDALVRDLTALQSRGQIDADKKAGVGLNPPAFTIDLTGADGASAQLLIGDRSAVGDSLYVQAAGRPRPDVVDAGLYEKIARPASEFRSPKLVQAAPDQISQVTIEQPDHPPLRLDRIGGDWKIIAPTTMPADKSAVDGLISSIANISAVEFLPDAKTGALAGLNHPAAVVRFNVQPPQTRPTSTAPTTLQASVLTFGRPENIQRKNVYISAAGTDVQHTPLATVPMRSLETIQKKPLDLRDRDAASIDPEKVVEFTVFIEHPAPATQPATGPATHPATGPATQPASLRTIRIVRRPENLSLGPVLAAPIPATAAASQPATGPASEPATLSSSRPTTAPATQSSAAATQPTEPLSKWMIASEANIPADEGQVRGLLDALHPLRALKYLESVPPPASPAATYVLRVRTNAVGAEAAGTHYDIRIIDPGPSATPVATFQDLAFDVDRSLIRRLEGDFKTKQIAPITPPPMPGMGMPGGFHGGFEGMPMPEEE